MNTDAWEETLNYSSFLPKPLTRRSDDDQRDS
jgi:hypothetical protein